MTENYTIGEIIFKHEVYDDYNAAAVLKTDKRIDLVMKEIESSNLENN